MPIWAWACRQKKCCCKSDLHNKPFNYSLNFFLFCRRRHLRRPAFLFASIACFMIAIEYAALIRQYLIKSFTIQPSTFRRLIRRCIGCNSLNSVVYFFPLLSANFSSAIVFVRCSVPKWIRILGVGVFSPSLVFARRRRFFFLIFIVPLLERIHSHVVRTTENNDRPTQCQKWYSTLF